MLKKSRCKRDIKVLKKELKTLLKERKNIDDDFFIIINEDQCVEIIDQIDLCKKRISILKMLNKSQARYDLLIKKFTDKYYGIDLTSRIRDINLCCDEIDYIDGYMNKIPQLYEICCGLFKYK